jgi:hypothetical protein
MLDSGISSQTREQPFGQTRSVPLRDAVSSSFADQSDLA